MTITVEEARAWLESEGRNLFDGLECMCALNVALEAAEGVIERLEGDLQVAEAVAEKYSGDHGYLLGENKGLKAEVKRLRQADVGDVGRVAGGG